MPTPPLIVRADANVAMGVGHVMRCVALAQSWQDQGGRVTFVMAQSTPAIEQYLRKERLELVHSPAIPGSREDARCLGEISKERDADWLIVDGYQFGQDYQLAIKQAGLKLLSVDDTGNCQHYFADVILNQNVTASEAMYPFREPYTCLLLGSKYVVLRREFEPWRKWQRSFAAIAQRILVTMGGSDPDVLTLPLMKALSEIGGPDLRVIVVAGGSNPRVTELQQAANEIGSRIQLLADVRDMATIMADSDLAIICGGGTLWEALYMSCPTLTYSRPGIQQQIVEALSSSGGILDLGLAENFSESRLQTAVEGLISSIERRRSMSRRGREIIDGWGTNRVLEGMDRSMSMNPSTLPGNLTDMRLRR
jgi:UDP-2,4-diacetamido-2,4,6-trideoxy-beta-L-altropyranose hydrolase